MKIVRLYKRLLMDMPIFWYKLIGAYFFGKRQKIWGILPIKNRLVFELP